MSREKNYFKCMLLYVFRIYIVTDLRLFTYIGHVRFRDISMSCNENRVLQGNIGMVS